MMRWSKSRSASEARSASSRSPDSRRRRAPPPPAAATSPNVWATPARVSGAAAAEPAAATREALLFGHRRGRREGGNHRDDLKSLRPPLVREQRAGGDARDLSLRGAPQRPLDGEGEDDERRAGERQDHPQGCQVNIVPERDERQGEQHDPGIEDERPARSHTPNQDGQRDDGGGEGGETEQARRGGDTRRAESPEILEQMRIEGVDVDGGVRRED